MTAAHARTAHTFADRHRGRVIGHVAGRPVLSIAGGSEGPPNPPAPPAPPADPPKTYTAEEHQAELNRVGTAQKAEGKAAAERHIAEQLGVSVAEAKKLIEAKTNADRDAMSEAERAKADAVADRAAATAEKAAAAADRHEAAVLRALSAAGVKTEKVERAIRSLDIAPGADAAAVSAAVESLKTDEAGWFGASVTPPPAPGSYTGGQQQPSTPPTSNREAGKAEALKRFPQLATKT